MRTAGAFAAAVLNKKPNGAILSQYPLIGLPQPQFAQALKSDAVALTYAGHISLGEALKAVKNSSYSWATVKLYYAAFYYIKANLAFDEVVVFYHNNREYICDSTSGFTQEFGRSSHQFNWNKISNIQRLSGWFYQTVTGDALSKLRVMRENANYKQSFTDPFQREEYQNILHGNVEKAYRAYKADSTLLYTFLEQHVAMALPISLAVSTSSKTLNATCSFTTSQLYHLHQVWPFAHAGLW